MTDTDRQRLAAILGMLGSAHAGERAAAALQAETLRRRLGMTWERVMGSSVVYIDRPPVVVRPRFSLWGSILIYITCVSGVLFTIDIGLQQFGMALSNPQCVVASPGGVPPQPSLQTAFESRPGNLRSVPSSK